MINKYNYRSFSILEAGKIFAGRVICVDVQQAAILTFAFLLLAGGLAVCLFLDQKHKSSQKRYELLMKIGRELALTTRLKPLLKKVVDTVVVLTGAEAASLLLLDEEKNELYFEVALGEKGELLKEVRLKVGEGIAGWVAANGLPYITDDVEKDPRFLRSISEEIKFKNKAMMCAPVILEGRTLGVIQVINKKGGGTFSKADLDFLVSIAAQVAVALCNAQEREAHIKDTYRLIASMANALEPRGEQFINHGQRVAEYAARLAAFMGLSEEDVDAVRLAGLVHDIGLYRLLPAAGSGTLAMPDESFAEHPVLGAELIPEGHLTGPVKEAVRWHHEHWDGSGFPDGIKGDGAPLIAWIMGVADTLDSLVAEGCPLSEAVEEVRKGSGTRFHPRVAEAALWCFGVKDS